MGADASCDKCGEDVPVAADVPCPELEALRDEDGGLELHGFHMRFRFMPAGSFLQGSVSGYREEQPQRLVYLTESFWIADTPVTQRTFERVMHFNPSATRGSDLPVENASWHQACDFCYCLAQQAVSEGVLPDGIECRLPTEAEWEYAAQSSLLPGSGVELDDLAWHRENSGLTTHPVATRQATPTQLYDLLGNVREWCLDWLAPRSSEHVVDPYGPESGDRKVLKGGSFMVARRRCRASDRIGMRPAFRHCGIGFRPLLVKIR
jgi:formylglycine-generating enzyme required for sulfatase activity